MQTAGDSNKTSEKHSGPRWLKYAFLLVGIVFALLLVKYFGWRDMIEAVRSAKPAPLLVMGLLTLAGFWVRALKWHCALGEGNDGVRIFFLAKFAGNWTPARAGELAPLMLERYRSVRVASWIVYDRFLEAGITLLLGVLGAMGAGILSWTVGGGLLGFAVLLCGAAWFASRKDGFGSVAPRWSQKASAIHAEYVRIGAKIVPLGLLTLAAKLTDFYAVVALCHAFGYGLSLALVAAARCAHALVSIVPLTPDATGAPYAAAAVLIHEYGAIPYVTLTVALGLEIAVIQLLLFGCFLLTLIDPKRSPR